METIILLLIVLLFAAPLFILASPFVVYLVPMVLIGLAISYWLHRRPAHA